MLYHIYLHHICLCSNSYITCILPIPFLASDVICQLYNLYSNYLLCVCNKIYNKFWNDKWLYLIIIIIIRVCTKKNPSNPRTLFTTQLFHVCKVSWIHSTGHFIIWIIEIQVLVLIQYAPLCHAAILVDCFFFPILNQSAKNPVRGWLFQLRGIHPKMFKLMIKASLQIIVSVL